MKISIAISVLIVVIAALLRWKDGQRLSEVEETHGRLVAEAAELGISVDSENPEAGALVTKRAREDKEAEARDAAKKLIAFAHEMEGMQENGEQPGEEMQERIAEFMDLMLSLDSGQLKILIAEFRANTEMKEETRNGMIAFAIMTLANDHPEAALSLFIESEDLLGEGMLGEHLLSSSLAKWASTDPDGALEWVRKNGKNHPDLITDDVKAGLVKGAASNDMSLGFDLISELKMDDASDAISAIAQGIKTPQERTEFLGLLRAYSKANPAEEGEDAGENAMHYIAAGVGKDGFEEGSQWIAENQLTDGELDEIASSISYSAKSGEKGQWIAWMGENLAEDNRDDRVSNAMRSWTSSDYRAAGEWLATAPEGPTKNASVKGYADAVAKYDPQTASQWALTLPEGEVRTDTLKSIYRKWPTDTPEQKDAKAAFKQEHGIK